MDNIDQLGSLITPEVILPGQVAALAQPWQQSGEIRLLWDLLMDAIYCAQLEPRNDHCRRLRADAEWWIAGAPGAKFGFVEVCDYLGLDPEIVRKRLWTDQIAHTSRRQRRTTRGGGQARIGNAIHRSRQKSPVSAGLEAPASDDARANSGASPMEPAMVGESDG